MNLKDYFPKKPPTPEEFFLFVLDELNKEHEPLHTTDQCRGDYQSPVVHGSQPHSALDCNSPAVPSPPTKP